MFVTNIITLQSQLSVLYFNGLINDDKNVMHNAFGSRISKNKVLIKENGKNR